MKSLPNPFDRYPSLGNLERREAEYDPSLFEASEGEQVEDPEAGGTRPLTPLRLLILFVVAVLGWRLINLQIIEGTKNRVLAEDNRLRNREIPAPRGEIRDSQGKTLASSVAAYSLALYPAELPRDRREREEVVAEVERVTGLDLSPVRKELNTSGLTSLYPIVLATEIERDTALLWRIRLHELAGVSVETTPQRTYAEVPGLGHILGYVGKVAEEDQKRWPHLSGAALVGKTGIEGVFEEDLQGTVGKEHIEVDAKGRVERILAAELPVPGETLTLTLDSRLQTSLATHLADLTVSRGQTKAAALALDPRTGGILALVSLPSFDPTIFVSREREADRRAVLEDADRPLVNRVTSGTYPSGSTIKPVIAAAALEERIVTERTTLDTSAGVIEVGAWRFPDWKIHGLSDVRQALAESNDIFFYALGGGYAHIAGLGVENMQTWLSRFGFGRATGIDLPGERPGLVPSAAWKEERFGESWYIGDSYHLAIGQGFFLATPLQLAMATAAIANGGTLLKPYLVANKQAAGGGIVAVGDRSVTLADLVRPEVASTIREGMRLTVTEGTARSLSTLPLPVAGKTGTAQFGTLTDGSYPTHSWFTGFAPSENPELAVVVLVEGGGESTDAAVPVAKRFFEDWWHIVHPDQSVITSETGSQP